MEKALGNILVVNDDRNLCKQLIECFPPEGDNDFSLLQRIRSADSAPILVLSGRGECGNLITGLEMGADDYLQKPFNPRELVARIRALLSPDKSRRKKNGILPQAHIRKELGWGDVEIDTGERVVFCSGIRIAVTSVEFSILEILLSKAGQFVSREELMQEVLGRALSPYDRSIDVHISRLRKKLGNEVPRPERIKTIRGVGYIYGFTRPADVSPII